MKRRSIAAISAVLLVVAASVVLTLGAGAAPTITLVDTFTGAPNGPFDAIPAGAQPGDFVMVAVAPSNNNTPSRPAAGWTNGGSAGVPGGQMIYLYYRFVPPGGFNSAQNFNSSNGTNVAVASVAYRGVDPISPVLSSNFGSDGGSLIVGTQPVPGPDTGDGVDDVSLLFAASNATTGFVPQNPAGLTLDATVTDSRSVAIASTAATGVTDTTVEVSTTFCCDAFSWILVNLNPDSGLTRDLTVGVFDNIAADALSAGGTPGLAGNDYIPFSATVYRDDGDGVPDGGDTAVNTILTLTANQTTVPLPEATYWIAASPETSSTPELWFEQTYGPSGARCDDGLGGISERATAGPCYGGQNASVSDDGTNNLSASEHVARVDLFGSDVTVDFGFSTNVVVNTRDGDDDATSGRSIQGSLRQFITNANTNPDASNMRFVPVAGTSASSAGLDWWMVLPSTPLPNITSQTAVDGTPYDYRDGVTLVPPSSIMPISNVGTTATAVPAIPYPQFHINGETLRLDGADSASIRGLAIHNGTAPSIDIANSSQVAIDNVFAGTSPPGITPLQNPSQYGINVTGSTSGSVANSFITRNSEVGVLIDASSPGWLIEESVVGNNGTAANIASNGIETASALSITTSLITANQGSGLFVSAGTGPSLVSNSTIDGNGAGTVRDSGIHLAGSGTAVTQSVITNNGGAGIRVAQTSSGNEFTANSIFDNADFGIDLLETGNDAVSGAAPYHTPNDQGDTDVGGNNLTNKPVIEWVTSGPGTVTVAGWAPAGSSLEFFESAVTPSFFGDGQTYLHTAAEGSGADTDATTSAYNTPSGNVTGASRFEITLPVPSSPGTWYTATAAVAGETSEFSNSVRVDAWTPIVTVTSPLNVDEETLLTETATAVDPNPGTGLTWTLEPGVDPVPSGMSIDSGGTITWTPDETLGGQSFSIMVKAADSFGFSGAAPLTINVIDVNQAPVFDADVAVEVRTVGEAFDYTHLASDPDGDTLVWSVDTLPPGIALDPVTGRLFGTHTTPGSWAVNLTVTDNASPALSDTLLIDWTVVAVNSLPVASVTSPLRGDESTTFTTTASVSDPDSGDTHTWSLAPGTDLVPAWLTIDPATGVISAAPAESDGPTSVGVSVVVSDGTDSDTATLSVIVDETNQAPALPGDRLATAAVGEAVSIANAASDPDLPANTLLYSVDALPPGLAIDPATGEITGTIAPTAVASYVSNVTVVDDGSPSLSDLLRIDWTITGIISPDIGEVQVRTFVDTGANGLATGAVGDTDNPLAGTIVSLFLDDGDGIAEAASQDTLVTSTTTTGDHTFTGLAPGDYWVIVDSREIATAGWPEQTYGPAGGLCGQEPGGVRTTAGLCIGGRNMGFDDGLSTLAPDVAEHISLVTVANDLTTDVDFGFSFEAITVFEESATPLPGPPHIVAQGTLRQFILNANAGYATSTVFFEPETLAGTDGLGNQWAVVNLESELPAVTADGVTVDGTLHRSSGTFGPIADPNPSTFALDPIGTSASVDIIEGADVELAGKLAFSTSIGSTVRDLSINPVTGAALTVTDSSGFNISSAQLAQPPVPGAGPATSTAGLVVQNSANGAAAFIAVGAASSDAVQIDSTSTDWMVRNTLIEGARNGVVSAAPVTLSRVVVSGVGNDGLILGSTANGSSISQSTVTASGNAGALIDGADNVLISESVFADNVGNGVAVLGDASDVVAYRSHFSGNAAPGIDLYSGLLPAPIDGRTLNDDGDGDTGGNQLLNTPVITSAIIDGTTIYINGFAPSGATIDFYGADTFSGDAEGAIWLQTAVEGVADSEPGTGSYFDAAAGAESAAEMFGFSYSVLDFAAASSAGITATATVGGTGTSEFSPATVIDRNVAPTVDPVLATINEGSTLTQALSATDLTTLAPVSFAVTAGTDPVPAGLIVDGSNNVVWTPDEATGPATINLTVQATDSFGLTSSAALVIEVGEVNAAPSISGISSVTVQAGDPVASLLFSAADVDLPANTLTFSAVGLPAGASIDAATGELVFAIPATTAPGTTTSTIIVTDNGSPTRSATLQLDWNITAPPTTTAAPTTTTTLAPNTAPAPSDDAYKVEAGLTLTLGRPGVLANDTDSDGDVLTASLIAAPGAGELVLADDGSFVFDATTATPGEYTFTYSADDGQGATTKATALITVTAPDLAFVNNIDAIDDTITSFTTEPIEFNVLDNDRADDFDTLQLTQATPPDVGQLEVASDGRSIYDAPTGWQGETTFVYTIESASGQQDTATVTIVVGSPVVKSDDVTLSSYVTVAIAVLENDFAEDGLSLRIVDFDQPSNGLVELSETGTLLFTPDPGFVGVTQFAYTAGDENGATASAIVRVEVLAEAETRGRELAKEIGLTLLDVEAPVDDSEITPAPSLTDDGVGLFVAALFRQLGALQLNNLWLAMALLWAITFLGFLSIITRRPQLWAVTNVDRKSRLPAFETIGSTEALFWFAADAEGIWSTGKTITTGGVVWRQVETPAGVGWVEADKLAKVDGNSADSAESVELVEVADGSPGS